MFLYFLWHFSLKWFLVLKKKKKTDAKAETPILWPPHVKSWLIGKDPDAGRDWGQEEKGTTEDEMVAGWHHWLDGHESEWTPGVGDGQGGLACCYSWGCKESDTTDRLNWTKFPCLVASTLQNTFSKEILILSKRADYIVQRPPFHKGETWSRRKTQRIVVITGKLEYFNNILQW